MPDKLDAVFIQRNNANEYYEQINISGSDLIVYLNEDGKIEVDKISVWASKYGLGGGSTVKISATDTTSNYLENKLVAGTNITITKNNTGANETLTIISSGGATVDSAIQAMYATQSIFATQSLYSTQSLYATQSLTSITASYSLSASYIGNGVDYYIPHWNSNSLISGSILSITQSSSETHLKIGPNSYGSYLLLGGTAFFNTASARIATNAGQLTLNSEGSLPLFLNFYNGAEVYAGTVLWVNTTTTTATASIDGNISCKGIKPMTNNSWSLGTNVLLWSSSFIGNIYGTGGSPTSRLYGTSSFAISASWAPGGTGTSLTTASTYPITSSHALTASYISGSILGLIASSSYSFTSSYSLNVLSSSFSTSASWAPSGTGTSLTTASTYPITSSWAISASWAPGGAGTSLTTASTYPITSSWAITASFALNGGGTGTSLTTASTYPITSSWSNTSSYFHSRSGSGAWKIYVDMSIGNLVFEFS